MCDCNDKTTIIVMLSIISQKLSHITDLLESVTIDSTKPVSCHTSEILKPSDYSDDN